MSHRAGFLPSPRGELSLCGARESWNGGSSSRQSTFGMTSSVSRADPVTGNRLRDRRRIDALVGRGSPRCRAAPARNIEKTEGGRPESSRPAVRPLQTDAVRREIHRIGGLQSVEEVEHLFERPRIRREEREIGTPSPPIHRRRTRSEAPAAFRPESGGRASKCGPCRAILQPDPDHHGLSRTHAIFLRLDLRDAGRSSDRRSVRSTRRCRRSRDRGIRSP